MCVTEQSVSRAQGRERGREGERRSRYAWAAAGLDMATGGRELEGFQLLRVAYVGEEMVVGDSDMGGGGLIGRLGGVKNRSSVCCCWAL